MKNIKISHENVGKYTHGSVMGYRKFHRVVGTR